MNTLLAGRGGGGRAMRVPAPIVIQMTTFG